MAEIGMGKGAGAGSFAAGFGRGLSRALLMNRERSDQKQREEQARKDRLFQTMLPVYLQNAEDVADLEPLLQSQFPDTFTQGKKGGKKGESPFDKIAHFIGPLLGMNKQKPIIEGGWPGKPTVIGNDLPEQGGISGMLGRTPGPFGRQPEASGELPPAHQPPGVTGGVLNSLPQPINQQGGGQPLPQPFDQPPDISQTMLGGRQMTPAATAGTKPRRTLFGVPLLSEEDKLQREIRQVSAKETAQIQGKVDAARRMFASGAYKTLADAYAAVGLQPRVTGASANRYGGILKGDQAAAGETDVYGRPLEPNTYYRVQVHPDGELAYTPTVAPGGNLGVDREAIARAQFGGKSFAQLTPEQQQQVLTAEQKRAGQMSQERALGTEKGQFEAPIDIKTAQETNLPVGTTSADVAGQTVQTTPDRERVQSLNVLRTDLTRVQDLLAVLPSEQSLAGVAPNAVLAVRKRMNSDSGIKDADGNALSYRSALAQLQANVDSMVNVLARVRGEQRGTQTERDADRAYNAVVQLQAGLLDPLGGDTQESAKARIKEALAGLDRVMAQIPTQAVTPKPGAKPAAGTPAAKPGATAAPAKPGATGLKMDPKTGDIIDPVTNKVVVPGR